MAVVTACSLAGSRLVLDCYYSREKRGQTDQIVLKGLEYIRHSNALINIKLSVISEFYEKGYLTLKSLGKSFLKMERRAKATLLPIAILLEEKKSDGNVLP
jgi:hypothetical protein